jgi:hypothetical protein
LIGIVQTCGPKCCLERKLKRLLLRIWLDGRLLCHFGNATQLIETRRYRPHLYATDYTENRFYWTLSLKQKAKLPARAQIIFRVLTDISGTLRECCQHASLVHWPLIGK